MSTIEIEDGEITVDAALVAEGLGLSQSRLQALMRSGSITSRCEIGQDADAGRYRLNFLFGNRVLRYIVDENGKPLGPAQIEFVSRQQKPAAAGGEDQTTK